MAPRNSSWMRLALPAERRFLERYDADKQALRARTGERQRIVIRIKARVRAQQQKRGAK